MNAKASSKKAGVLKILVVEDNPTDMKLVSTVLERAGHEVHEARSAEQAVQLLQKFTPDAILTDLDLPRMDGMSMIRQLKLTPETAEIPVIAITGSTGNFSNPHAREAGFAAFFSGRTAQEAGFTGYIVKPIDTRILAQQISEVLDQIQEGKS